MPRVKRKAKRMSSAISKRWCFSNQNETRTNVHDDSLCAETFLPEPNLRLKKLSSAPDIPVTNEEVQYVLVNFNCLNDLVKNISCPECQEKKISFVLGQKMGFAYDVKMKCDGCELSKHALSSRKIDNATHDINIRITQAFKHIGKGYTAIEKFCAVMNMPVYSSKTFRSAVQKIEFANKEAFDTIMKNVRQTVKNAYTQSETVCNEVTDISVSFDGSWLTRGHSSLVGVGCVIDILTGYAVDFEVMSKKCRLCENAKRDLGESSAEFHIWFTGHESQCEINHHGSSNAMELKAAECLWKRSMQLGFRYTTMLSDGDSKTFNYLSESKVYGDVNIVKEECINHVSKRLGTGLREVVKKSKAKGITLGGKKHGSLKEETIKKLTNYYQNAIIKNKGDVHKMKTAIYATLFHAISNDKKPQHSKCPEGPDSWCFFQSAIAKNITPGLHKDMVKTPINESFLPYILPVYQRLASEDLLKRCIRCATQNANESLHSMIWSKCPKDKFAYGKSVKNSVRDAICEFNVGVLSTLQTQQNVLGLGYGKTSQTLGLILSERKEKFQIRRRKKKFDRARKLVKLAMKRRDMAYKKVEGTTYKAGFF